LWIGCEYRTVVVFDGDDELAFTETEGIARRKSGRIYTSSRTGREEQY